MFEPVCENGHRIGFRGDGPSEGLSAEWRTGRCVQCGGQPLVNMVCPHCDNRGARVWFHETKKRLLLLQCTSCGKWIDHKDTFKRTNREVIRNAPYLAVIALLAFGFNQLLSTLGASPRSANVGAIGFGIVCSFFLVRRDMKRYTRKR